MEIGKTIKKLRKDKKITLRELSEKSGVALATLSRIETGKMTGTVRSHHNIANALDISITELYSGFEIQSNPVEMHSQKETADIFTHNDKASYNILTKKVLSKKMMPILLKLEKNAKTTIEQAQKGTEKFIYVLSGQLNININNKTYTLKQGDSFYFDASLPHSWQNTTKRSARAICVATPPSL